MPLTPPAVNLALVKMVLSLVAEDQLPFLKGTIEWVRNNAHAERRLPTVATHRFPAPRPVS